MNLLTLTTFWRINANPERRQFLAVFNVERQSFCGFQFKAVIFSIERVLAFVLSPRHQRNKLRLFSLKNLKKAKSFLQAIIKLLHAITEIYRVYVHLKTSKKRSLFCRKLYVLRLFLQNIFNRNITFLSEKLTLQITLTASIYFSLTLDGDAVNNWTISADAVKFFPWRVQHWKSSCKNFRWHSSFILLKDTTKKALKIAAPVQNYHVLISNVYQAVL